LAALPPAQIGQLIQVIVKDSSRTRSRSQKRP
jgi:hypothetical protein